MYAGAKVEYALVVITDTYKQLTQHIKTKLKKMFTPCTFYHV